ncbi:MAG: polysaccharide deacetylase family protein [Candidatus Sumerlaeaceae bacterium]|jgi:peptidoglycan/xylan/chitin deacetylase (PgdA/CDA1 family)
MPILTYHHIGELPPTEREHAGLWVSAENFAQQLAWLRAKGFVGLRVSELARVLREGRKVPVRWVAITFDDGWRDNFTTAWPLLREFRFPATIFVTTQKLRSGAVGDSPFEMMSADELTELAAHGMEIGSHTRTHPKLTRLPDDAAREEIAGSREDLRQLLGVAPSSFAYPYGAHSARIERLVREAGYFAAVSTIRDNRVHPDQLFHMPRVMVMRTTSLRRFAYMFSFAYHAVHSWKNLSRWRDGR